MAHFPEMQPPEKFKHLEPGKRVDLTPEISGIPKEGVVKEILEEGDGEFYANANDKVTLKYTAYIGTEPAVENIFNSSEKDGKNLVFEVLKGDKVARGLEMAVMTMKVGERARITLAPMYAFGKDGNPPKVPPDSHVMYDAQIVSIEPEDISPDEDKSITKHVLKKGRKWSQPNEGCEVKLNIIGRFGNTVFIRGEKEFLYGEGTSRGCGIPEFVEEYLTQWKLDEIAVMKMAAKHCYGSEGCEKYGIPPNTDLEFKIHMIHFKRVKEIWEMDERERLNRCDMNKERGNVYVKRKEYTMARKIYSKVVDSLEFEMLLTGDDEIRRKGLLTKTQNNLAMVYLKEENFIETKRCCDKVLQEEPDDVKALFRRGMANYNTKDYEEASNDFDAVLKYEPNNTEAIKHKKLCDDKLRETSSSGKVIYRRMCKDLR